MKKALFIVLVVCVASCTQKDSGVSVSLQKPVAKAAVPKAVSRSEPVFYNGKTYRVDLAPDANGVYAIVIGGMSNGQQKDAIAVATSSVRYFGCPDGKTGKLTNAPSYVDGNWKMAAKCG